LAGINGDLTLTANLDITDTSSGFEATDTLSFQMIMNDGTNTITKNLLTPFDRNNNGVMNGGATLPLDDEFNQNAATDGNYTSGFLISDIIPDNIISVQLVATSVKDNATSERIVIRDVVIALPPASILLTTNGLSTFDNKGTVTAADDEFSAPVTITTANLPGGSTTWTSNVTPATGPYSTANVTFGPFLVSAGAASIVLTDSTLNTIVSNNLSVSAPTAKSLAAAAATGITRVENGPGAADDSVTFTTTLTRVNLGPNFTATTTLGSISNVSTPYVGGPIVLTLTNVPVTGTAVVTFTDDSYNTVVANLNVALPNRYIIGEQNVAGPSVDLITPITPAPAAQWLNNPTARTLTMTAGIATASVVESESIDLSAIGDVAFTANFRAADTSATSNFETADKFKAELIYVIGGVTQPPVNLIAPYDFGNGAAASGPVATPGGPNGAPDGFINGYTGVVGTDAANGTVYAAAVDDYNGNRIRDEFNSLRNATFPNGQPAADSINNTFPLSATIPANVDSVKLVITGISAAGSEVFEVKDILFTTIVNDDTDSDGLSDNWEQLFFETLSQTGTDDFDKDGINNNDEETAGTDPTDPSSGLKVVSISRNGDVSVSIRFSSITGRSYTIERSTALSGWVDSGVAPVTGAPEGAGPNLGTQEVTVPLPASPLPERLFYRVKVTNP
jgi:hypothetical protein